MVRDDCRYIDFSNESYCTYWNFLLGAAPFLMSPDPQTLGMACQWVQLIESRGLTDILTPYQIATNMLLNANEANPAHQNGKEWAVSPNPMTSNIPVIFLITDGAVRNEHDICKFAQQQAEECQKMHPTKKTIRTFTYGIGPYVNQFFLKALASKGRGYSHICLHESRIELTIIELMNRCTNPLLVNVFLDIPSDAGVLHTSPSICPDLYHGRFCHNLCESFIEGYCCFIEGCPIVLTGKFMGNFPSQIFASGIDSSGQMVRIAITVRYV